MKFRLIRLVMIGLITAVLMTGGYASALAARLDSSAIHENKDISRLLTEIYTEVVAFGKYPGQSFFKREFFVGEDDDDTNKDIHVAIVIHEATEEEKMTIQATYMKRSKSRPFVGIAKNAKSIKCSCKENKIEIIQSGFSEREMKVILKGILHAIQNKKNLLKKMKQTAG